VHRWIFTILWLHRKIAYIDGMLGGLCQVNSRLVDLFASLNRSGRGRSLCLQHKDNFAVDRSLCGGARCAHSHRHHPTLTTLRQSISSMDPVSALGVAAGAAQFADMTANVFMSLFKYFQTVKRSPKLSKQLREEVSLIHKVLEDLKSTLENIDTPTTYSFNDIVEEFSLTMKDMERRIEVKKDEVVKRFIWPFTQKENEEYLSKLERYKTTFTLALNTIQRCVIPNRC
jgi:hypothetical protein